MATACQTPAACAENPQGLAVIETAALLRQASVAEGCADEVVLLGLNAPGDSFGGFYAYDAASVLPDDGFTVLVSIHGGAFIKHL